MTILSIGRTSYDITCPVEEYPVEGTKYLLNEKIESGGGSAANIAYLLGKWGETSYFAGVIGSDDYGTKIKKEFEQAMVKTEFIETSYEVGTPLSIILVNKKNGSRTRFDVVGATQPQLKKYEYGINPDVIVSDGKEYSATINALNKYPSAISIVDAGRVDRDLLELCKYVKYIVCSKGFAETVSGYKIDYNNSGTLVNVYKKLKDKYPNNEIIVTLENMGAMYTYNGEIKVMPSIKVEQVDPSCSGDIFHGVFAYCLANHFDLEKAITYSNIAAGLSVTKIGGRTSIPTIKEVINYYNQKFNIQAPVEEKKVEEVKPQENVLPDIPNASNFTINTPVTNNVSDIGASFFGGSPNTNTSNGNNTLNNQSGNVATQNVNVTPNVVPNVGSPVITPQVNGVPGVNTNNVQQ